MAPPGTAMRVAITLEQCWHRVPGGTARAAMELVDALGELGEVPDGDGTRPLDLVGVAARHRHPPPAPWVPSITVASLGVPRRLLYETWHTFGWPKVERATGRIDVIHATGLAMPPPSVPVVVSLHDLAFLRAPQQFTRNGLHFFHGALNRIRRDATIVLCSSEATQRDAIDAGIEDVRTRVVPLGVRTVAPISAATIDAARARFDLPPRYVLQLGTAEPRKNRIGVLRAASSLPDDVAVVFAGEKGWGTERAPSTGSRVVRDLGFVSEPDRCALMAGAAAFCYPSHWEGFGLPVLEAMALGTPVVTSERTAMAEVVGGAALLVDPADPASIGTALCRILDDDVLAAELRAEGPRTAERFPWSRTASLTAQAYADAVAP